MKFFHSNLLIFPGLFFYEFWKTVDGDTYAQDLLDNFHIYFSARQKLRLQRHLSQSIESPVKLHVSLEETAPASSNAAQAKHTLYSSSLQCYTSGKNPLILCLSDARRCSTNFTAFCLQLSAESNMLATTKPV